MLSVSTPVGLQVLNFEVLFSVLNVTFCCCFSWDLLPLSFTTSQLPLLPLSGSSLPLNFSVSDLFNLVSVSEVFLQFQKFSFSMKFFTFRKRVFAGYFRDFEVLSHY